jgi:hypothetical protein
MNVSTLLDLNFGKCPQPARHSARASFGLAAIGMGFRSLGAPAPVTKDHLSQSPSASGKSAILEKNTKFRFKSAQMEIHFLKLTGYRIFVPRRRHALPSN